MDQENTINSTLVEIEELEGKIAPDDPTVIVEL